MKCKMRLTITVEYDAESEWYGTEDPEQMAQIDCANYKNDPSTIIEIFNQESGNITVRPIKKTIRKDK